MFNKLASLLVALHILFAQFQWLWVRVTRVSEVYALLGRDHEMWSCALVGAIYQQMPPAGSSGGLSSRPEALCEPREARKV